MTATNQNKEEVILVNELDQEVGVAEKILAHQNNWLHRAFSIFIRHAVSGDILLQKRSAEKYHCPLLWTNTCCSHPKPNEPLIKAAERRLQEEFGFTTSLKSIGSFHYNAHFENGLSENEIDHVLLGVIDDAITLHPNPVEIAAWEWISLTALETRLKTTPAEFTPWLGQALGLLKQY